MEAVGPCVWHTFPSLVDSPQTSLPIHSQKPAPLHRPRSGCSNNDQHSSPGHSGGRRTRLWEQSSSTVLGSKL